ncbi:WecB/TagA/CpsF family glycosyltransferase [Devosia sp. RR2S18]|uniref:WecB/TagA/CpsF family glycosyltransferase n=1 Tax=Devosia rhizosphaerae TaxID=3049774 RepID=UPI002541E946|nr:WecB/TagA/CpsF family glycosyltransferase [Devosia sp. RR2S18]WIJ23911.1 WecB/TagA/CpsF family glycosyltransferase [Devosia sp. RR2S18]
MKVRELSAFSKLESYDVLGVPVSAVTPECVARIIQSWASDDAGRMVTAPDVSNVVRAQDDPLLMSVHRNANLVLPDGTPLVWIGKRRGVRVERTCGPDTMDFLMSQPSLKHYLYGGKPGVSEMVKAHFQRKYPQVQIVGHQTPPYHELTEGELAELSGEIEKASADVVWIGLSSPKQEYLMQRLVRHTSCTLLAVGAAFDFHAGTVRRAPAWMQKSGLEWLWRLIQDPARLWPRYILLAPRFVWLTAIRRKT